MYEQQQPTFPGLVRRPLHLHDGQKYACKLRLYFHEAANQATLVSHAAYFCIPVEPLFTKMSQPDGSPIGMVE
jgi:hypothetical protein